MLRAAALCAIALSTAPAWACPMMQFSDHVVASDGVTIHPGGGVLVVTTASFGEPPAGPPAIVDAQGAAVDAVSDPIAPGLSRLRPTTLVAGDLSVVSGRRGPNVKRGAPPPTGTATGGTTITVHVDPDAAPALKPPALAGVTGTRSRSAPPPPPPYPPDTTTTITLAAAPPADAWGLVFYGPDKQARAYLKLDPAARTYTIRTGGKGCNDVGSTGALIGESVSVAFVDTSGRVTARSKPVRVARAVSVTPTVRHR